MDDSTAILVSVIFGLLLTFFGIKRQDKKDKATAAPKNQAANVARTVAQEEFQKNLDAINKDLKGDSPADDLASRGNTRRRR
jgi:hypothetical protein